MADAAAPAQPQGSETANASGGGAAGKIARGATNPWVVALVVSLAAFMEVLDTTIVNVSLAQIAGNLGAGQDESTWVLTAYLVSNAIILPLSGWLSDTMGRKNYFMMSIAGFTLASFLCGSSTSLTLLVGWRLLQGMAGGGLQPTQQSIVLDAFPIAKRGMAFGIVGITMIVAPILGPTLGGWITDNYSWRWVFFINVPVGIIAVLLVNHFVEDPPHAVGKKQGRVDYIGLTLITLCIGALQIMLDKGQQDDWFESSFIVTCAIISAVAGVLAVYWLLRQKNPVVDLGLLKDRAFGLSCLMIFVTGFSLYGGSALLPLLLQSEYGYNATLAGLVLSPGGFAVIFLMPLMGKLSTMIEAKWLILTGMIIMAGGMFYSSILPPDLDYSGFVARRITQVLGLPFLFIPISTLAFMNIPKEKNNKASAFYSLCRNIGGSVGIAIAATYVVRQEQVHQTFLGHNLSKYSPTFREYFRQHLQLIGTTKGAMGNIYQELLHQSAILAYSDVFELLTLMAIITGLFALVMPANKPKAGGDPPAVH